jgi:threonine/homoserine/homoserine lactone efflux protein
MSEISILLGIGIALLVGAASPGPSFVLVARIAISKSRLDGLFAALGMGIGGSLFATASLLGLGGLLIAAPSAYWVVKVVGGLYLLYLGVRIWIGAKQPIASFENTQGTQSSTPIKSFAISLGTQLSNPKALVVYSSVFATFMPTNLSLGLGISIVVVVFSVETLWYTFVATTLSSKTPRRFYLRYKANFDRVAGSLLGLIGIKLVSDAASQAILE